MDFSQFQAATTRTLSKDTTMAVIALGVAGEAGEVADIVKKFVGQGHPFDLSKMKNELGDVLFYLAAMCDHLGIELEEVAKENVRKLEKRYPTGFSPEASMARRDVIHDP
jgi:NTP pyrophosphatase (non-canonical NTP hydrolase)